MSSYNEALRDECKALNAIYGGGTVELIERPGGEATAVLKLPDLPFSFLLAFPTDYPDVPPVVRGTNSTGSSGRGEGEKAVAVLVEAVGNTYNPGSVCLFDLIEEAAPRLQEHDHGPPQDPSADAANRSDTLRGDSPAEAALTNDPVSSAPPPQWVLAQSMVVNKSTFVARTLQVSSMTDVTSAVSQLLSTNKKVATATHNIKAWRIKPQDNGPGLVQDYDDDGETAAGGRLLHLMQLMDVFNVLVVVTRWYGGVKLGPDRFRIINNVAREALTNGGFVKEEKSKAKKDKNGSITGQSVACLLEVHVTDVEAGAITDTEGAVMCKDFLRLFYSGSSLKITRAIPLMTSIPFTIPGTLRPTPVQTLAPLYLDCECLLQLCPNMNITQDHWVAGLLEKPEDVAQNIKPFRYADIYSKNHPSAVFRILLVADPSSSTPRWAHYCGFLNADAIRDGSKAEVLNQWLYPVIDQESLTKDAPYLYSDLVEGEDPFGSLVADYIGDLLPSSKKQIIGLEFHVRGFGNPKSATHGADIANLLAQDRTLSKVQSVDVIYWCQGKYDPLRLQDSTREFASQILSTADFRCAVERPIERTPGDRECSVEKCCIMLYKHQPVLNTLPTGDVVLHLAAPQDDQVETTTN